jgi:hypothetical protein
MGARNVRHMTGGGPGQDDRGGGGSRRGTAPKPAEVGSGSDGL